MATYKITLEFETVLSVDGTRIKSETARETQIVTGVFADVAKVMFEHETNCIKHNRLPKLTKGVYTIFETKDSLNYINEYGCCVTQLCNKLGKNASSFLQLIQTNYRFCGDGLYMHSEIVGKYAKVDVLDVNGKPVKSI